MHRHPEVRLVSHPENRGYGEAVRTGLEASRGDAAPPVIIPRGVTLAGVPVGGLSSEQAQAALRPAFSRPVRLVYGDRAWRIVPARFGAKVTLAHGIADALRAQPDAAAGHWRRCVYLRPDHYEALCQLAILAERTGQDDAASLRQRAARVYQRRRSGADTP